MHIDKLMILIPDLKIKVLFGILAGLLDIAMWTDSNLVCLRL
jgi:hypothetical protein